MEGTLHLHFTDEDMEADGFQDRAAETVEHIVGMLNSHPYTTHMVGLPEGTAFVNFHDNVTTSITTDGVVQVEDDVAALSTMLFVAFVGEKKGWVPTRMLATVTRPDYSKAALGEAALTGNHPTRTVTVDMMFTEDVVMAAAIGAAVTPPSFGYRVVGKAKKKLKKKQKKLLDKAFKDNDSHARGDSGDQDAEPVP